MRLLPRRCRGAARPLLARRRVPARPDGKGEDGGSADSAARRGRGPPADPERAWVHGHRIEALPGVVSDRVQVRLRRQAAALLMWARSRGRGELYTLDAILPFALSPDIKHSEYMKECLKKGVKKMVGLIERRDLINYLFGKQEVAFAPYPLLVCVSSEAATDLIVY
jgi:hypothetical protein